MNEPLPTHVPSSSLFENFRVELLRHPPFAQMEPAAVDYFIAHCEQRYFAPGDRVVDSSDGPVEEIYFIREGAVTGTRGIAEVAFQFEAGDLFPLSAAVARRAVSARYSAMADTFVLALPVQAMREIAAMSPVFADFLNRRVAQFLELSRQALQVAYSSQTLSEQSMGRALGELVTRAPVTCAPDTPLREVLSRMHGDRIGSMLVVDEQRQLLGILTRYDVIGRIALAGVALDAPVSQVMVHPVHSLSARHTAQDAALLMSAQGVRHVPVTEDGAVIGMLSERDLFAMQRLSLKQVGTAIRAARDLSALKLVADDIRRFARSLLGQGVQARQVTSIISHLNDTLTQRLIELKAQEHGIELGRLCMIALGSEGRSEQTVATDQDNALILADDTSDAQRDQALAFGRDVNLALDACGYPLCRGGIMAGEPACCLTLREWRERFAGWIEHGAPQDLLSASIFFDMRALAGDGDMATRLQAEVVESARRTPRFLKQMAVNALSRSVPLNWMGAIDEGSDGSIDIKLQGTVLYVDAARVYALAHGITQTSTRERLQVAGARMGVAPAEYEAWVGGFEFMQMLRLRAQLEADPSGAKPNRLVLARLNDIDRKILKESFRIARSLQQRLQLDYER